MILNTAIYSFLKEVVNINSLQVGFFQEWWTLPLF